MHAPDASGASDVSRRVFLLGFGALLTGCSAAGRGGEMPRPAWDARRPRPYDPVEPYVPPPREPEPAIVAAPPASMPNVVARTEWSGGHPEYRLMQRMRPVRYITVHHDAQPMYATDRRSSGQRIEAIRRYHREDRRWGDIGYHYIVDRGGRVWDGRPDGWQGAHVRDHNDANIGVVCLGNFEVQQPSSMQIDALVDHVSALMRRYRVSLTRVRTHQEWAPTLCPGSSLQSFMVRARRDGSIV